MSIAIRIGELAKYYDLSLSEVAKRSGLGRATLHTYVKGLGQKAPAKAPAEAIAQILKAFPEISPNWMLHGEGAMIIDNVFHGIVSEPPVSFEKNIDFKERYYAASERIIQLQDDLINVHQELIGCLKSKISRPLEAVH